MKSLESVIFFSNMDIKAKFSVGQEVCLFNGVAMRIEHDEVFAILVSPEAVEGKEIDPQKKVSEMMKGGIVNIKVKYQLQRHQGILDEGILFESEEACKAYFRDFFAK